MPWITLDISLNSKLNIYSAFILTILTYFKAKFYFYFSYLILYLIKAWISLDIHWITIARHKLNIFHTAIFRNITAGFSSSLVIVTCMWHMLQRAKHCCVYVSHLITVLLVTWYDTVMLSLKLQWDISSSTIYDETPLMANRGPSAFFPRPLKIFHSNEIAKQKNTKSRENL